MRGDVVTTRQVAARLIVVEEGQEQRDHVARGQICVRGTVPHLGRWVSARVVSDARSRCLSGDGWREGTGGG